MMSVVNFSRSLIRPRTTRSLATHLSKPDLDSSDNSEMKLQNLIQRWRSLHGRSPAFGAAVLDIGDRVLRTFGA